MFIQLNQLKKGTILTPTRMITNSMIKNWKYAKECADVGGGLMPFAAELTVIELKNTLYGETWVRVTIGGSDPPKSLKISGEEYVINIACK